MLNDQKDEFQLAREANDHLRAIGLGDPGPGCLHVNTTTHRIVDGYNRERYFHGVNVVVKGPPWIPRQDKFDPYWSFSEEDMQLLQKWGLNAIRLGEFVYGSQDIKGIIIVLEECGCGVGVEWVGAFFVCQE